MRAPGIGLTDAAGRIGGVPGAYVGVFALDRGGAAGFFRTIWGLAMTALVIFMLLRGGRRRPPDP